MSNTVEYYTDVEVDLDKIAEDHPEEMLNALKDADELPSVDYDHLESLVYDIEHKVSQIRSAIREASR